jgi:hypothetical protein
MLNHFSPWIGLMEMKQTIGPADRHAFRVVSLDSIMQELGHLQLPSDRVNSWQNHRDPWKPCQLRRSRAFYVNQHRSHELRRGEPETARENARSLFAPDSCW